MAPLSFNIPLRLRAEMQKEVAPDTDKGKNNEKTGYSINVGNHFCGLFTV